MRILICSRSDSASVNIRDRLLEQGGWEQAQRDFQGEPVWARAEAIMVEIAGPSVTAETLDADLRHLGLPFRDVWFLSRHRAQSGQPSLTVHPIGNHGPSAEVGGRPESLCPAASRDMGALLRRLQVHRDAANLPHEVTYEATHHGPFTRYPSVFVEIGSDESWYDEPEGGRVVARAIEDVLCGEGRTEGPVLVGVGGGHYVPRMTDVALAGEADFGHLVPAYAVDPESDGEVLERAVRATPGCEGIYLHKKGLKGPQRQAVKGWAEALGVPLWDRPKAAAFPSG